MLPPEQASESALSLRAAAITGMILMMMMIMIPDRDFWAMWHQRDSDEVGTRDLGSRRAVFTITDGNSGRLP